MINNKIWLGILAMTLALGMTVVSCGSDDGDGPTGGNAFITGTADGSFRLPTEGQQVWTYDRYTGNWAVYPGGPHQVVCGNFGGTGDITNEILTFTLADATGATLEPLEDIIAGLFVGLFDDLTTFSVPDVEAGILRLREDEPSPSFSLDRGFRRFDEVFNVNGYNFRFQNVEFLYVDHDVTISHPGARLPPDEYDDNGFIYIKNITLRAFRVYLQKGWNALHFHSAGLVRETSTSSTETSTWTVHAGNPAELRWIIIED